MIETRVINDVMQLPLSISAGYQLRIKAMNGKSMVNNSKLEKRGKSNVT